MMNKTTIKHNDRVGSLKGHVRVFCHQVGVDPLKSNLKPWYEDPNVVVDLGRIRVAKFLSGETILRPDSVCIGNGGSQPINNISPSPPSKTDTTLGPSPNDGGRIGASPLEPGQTTTNVNATQISTVLRTLATVSFSSTFNANDLLVTDFPQYGASGGGLNLGVDALFVSELGLISSTDSDELFARVTFSPIVFQPGSSTSITVQWSISVL